MKVKERVRAEPKGESVPSYEDPYRILETTIKIREDASNTRLFR